MKKVETTLYAATYRMRKIEGELNFHLDVFGDHIAKVEGYKSVSGRDALYYFLMQKHGWLPSVARALSDEDLRFAFSEEMHGWSLPKEAIAAMTFISPQQDTEKSPSRKKP